MVEKYADIADQSWDDLPQPKVLPEGTWLLRGTNVSYFPEDKKNDKKARVVFFYDFKEPMDDVDQSELQALGEDYDFGNNDVAKQFYINKPKDWAGVRKHLELHGVDCEGKSQPETFDAFKGTEVLSYITKGVYTNRAGESVEQNVASTFAAV